MEQKQRDKIAWVLAVVLGLVLVYLLAVNVFKVGKKSVPPPPPPAAAMVPAPPPPSPSGAPGKSPEPPPVLDPTVLAAQQKIAAQLPRRNPFSAAAEGPSLPAPRSVGDGAARTVNNEIKFKVTGIVSQPGSNRRIAMINGKMFAEGDSIGEWIILNVNPKNVVLGNGAQQMVVGVK